jgi:TPR repeat protein
MKKRLISVSLALMFELAINAPAIAGFDEGVDAHQAGNFATALREFRPLAKNGEPASQFSLGVMYANGQGVAQDYKEAVNWYRKAAEQGDERAQYNLGVMYAIGQGVAPPCQYDLRHLPLGN